MTYCDNIPTLKTVQDFNTNAKVLNEVITSDQDQTSSKASDGENKITLSGIEKIALGKSRESAPVAFIDGVFEYEFPGFNASLSSFIVRSPNGVFPTQPLTRVVNGVGDYDYADITTQTITLTSSWSGGEIIAKSLDPTGTGVVQSPLSFTRSKLISAVGLSSGDYVIDTENGNAPFIIFPTGTTPLSGDVPMNSGQVAVLQRDSMGMYNVEWFGAKGIDSTVDQLTYFDLAAARSNEEANGVTKVTPIVIPYGDWRLSAPVSQSSMWILQPNAIMYGLPPLPSTKERDTSHLTGTVISYDGVRQSKTVRYGDPSFTVQKFTGKGNLAEIKCDGVQAGGITGTAFSNSSDTLNSGTIGVTAIGLGNSTDPDLFKGVWAAYFEGIKGPEHRGAVYCLESSMFLQRAADKISPYALYHGNDGTERPATNLWLTASGSIQGEETTFNPSAAMVVVGRSGKPSFDKGIIFQSDGIAAPGIAIAYADSYKNTWFSLKDSDTEVKAAEIAGGLPGTNGQFSISVWNDTASDLESYTFTPGAFSFAVDNQANIGTSLRRFKNAYFVNSPSVTSDSTQKIIKGSLSSSEISAAIKIARLPKVFQWISEVDKKGDSAYLHCSPMAQEVWSSLEAEGLDPTSYGFISNSDGVWSIKPQELLWMICAAQQSKIDNFESRLAALEALNG